MFVFSLTTERWRSMLEQLTGFAEHSASMMVNISYSSGLIEVAF
jgi:hypothetical protein